MSEECSSCGEYTDEAIECVNCRAKVCSDCYEETENGPTCIDCLENED